MTKNSGHPESEHLTMIDRYRGSKRFDRIALVPWMAKIASTNDEALEMLVSIIKSPEERSHKVMGVIRHSWLPAIHLMEEGDERVINIVVQALSVWAPEERKAFKIYLDKVESVSSVLRRISDD